MPLYIDLHVDLSLTPDEVKEAHVADKSIQDKYGVHYVQIMLNQPEGYVFCIVEGPDKESCARVHREAHGNVACNILEITESDFGALLNGKLTDKNDFTLRADGSIDDGLRTLLAVQLLGTKNKRHEARKLTNAIIDKNGGKRSESLHNDLTVLFDSGINAFKAGIDITTALKSSLPSVEVRMGLSAGYPLGAKGKYFEETIKAANGFAFAARHGQVVTSSQLKESIAQFVTHGHQLRDLSPPEEKFLVQTLDQLESVWTNNNLIVSDLQRELAISKTQLARRVSSVFGFSPGELIMEYRLRRACHLIDSGLMNVSEASLEAGFSDPSYFTKCFRKRFGFVPSVYSQASLSTMR